MPVAGQRDPRSVVTPDAFEVSEALLGMPLASPRRRAAALALDGLVIVAITTLTRNLPLLLGVAAAAFFIRAGFKRISVRGSVFGRAMRFSVGCLGVLVAIVTVSLGVALGPDLRREDDSGASSTANQILRAAGGLGLLDGIQEAASLEEAREVGVTLVSAGEAAGLEDDLIREALAEIAPDDAPWREAWIDELDRMLAVEAEAGEGSGRPDEGPVSGAGLAGLRAEVAALSDAEVIDRWADLRASDEMAESMEATLLEARVRDLVAGDSLGELEDRVAALQTRLEDTREGVRELEAQVDALEGRGIFSWLRELADEAGFGFGWAALYMTVFLSWWNGQTVGKRAFGIRVVRLDGGPITWWVAFERVGGYAAGFATGLLGFAQVWWDANRQAIHDRIVGTVVIYDGAEKVLDWESVL